VLQGKIVEGWKARFLLQKISWEAVQASVNPSLIRVQGTHAHPDKTPTKLD